MISPSRRDNSAWERSGRVNLSKLVESFSNVILFEFTAPLRLFSYLKAFFFRLSRLLWSLLYEIRGILTDVDDFLSFLISFAFWSFHYNVHAPLSFCSLFCRIYWKLENYFLGLFVHGICQQLNNWSQDLLNLKLDCFEIPWPHSGKLGWAEVNFVSKKLFLWLIVNSVPK